MKNSKKGFTLVELLVVIAILAVLASVAVVGYTNFIDQARESNDRTLVAQLNKAIYNVEDKNYSIHEATEVLREHGFDVSKIDATAKDNQILWSDEEDKFFYSADETPAGAIWLITDTLPATAPAYNIYYVGEDDIDIDYAATITVYTDEITDELTIDAPLAHIEHEGQAAKVTVTAVANASYIENGIVVELNVAKGNIVVNGTVSTLKVVKEAVVTEVKVTLSAGSETANLIVNADLTAATTPVITIAENVELPTIATEVETLAENLMEQITENLDVTGDAAAKEEVLEKLEDAVIEEAVDTTAQGDFAGGFGTSASPYLIANAEQLRNISKHYDTYNFYKIADGVTSLDLTGVGQIKLHGSFDGNGVKFVNLTTALFQNVGYQNQKTDCVIANFEATMNVTDGRALVRNIFNSGKTTFKNVTLHGYIEGLYNMASFYNYGTANYDGKGASYAVEFINSKSDVTLVSTSGNGIGGMIGHGYEGTGNTITITCDSKSVYTGKMYTTTGGVCDSFMYMASNSSKFILNGEETSGYDAKFNYASTKIASAKPVAGENGYTVDTAEGAAKLVVYINPQVNAHNEDGSFVDNNNGMTWSFTHKEIKNPGENVNVLELINSAVIVNGTDHDYSCEIKDGVLTIYSGRSDNYASGTVRLQVNQYDADGNLLAVGTVDLYTITYGE